MARVYLEFNNGTWNEVDKSNFWIDRALLNKLIALKIIQQKKWDGVLIVDGKERSGKSVLGMIMGWFMSNCSLTINNFAKGLDDAARKIASLPDKSVLILDEGSLVFSSKDSNTSVQKKLIKIMDVVGQKNMIFIICMPCFFDLNKTIAVRRSLFLCHVYPNEEYDRGQYAFWGERKKKVLYMSGKKNFDSYSFPEAEFVGEYLDFEPPFYKEYLEMVKKESLNEVLKDAMDSTKTIEQAVMENEALIYGYLIDNKIMTPIQITAIKGQARETVSGRYQMYKREMKPYVKKKVVVVGQII